MGCEEIIYKDIYNIAMYLDVFVTIKHLTIIQEVNGSNLDITAIMSLTLASHLWPPFRKHGVGVNEKWWA